MDLTLNSLVTLASAIVTLFGVLVGAGLRALLSRMKTLQTQHEALSQQLNDHLVEVPKTYATKVEFKEDISEIKEGVADIRRYLMGVNPRG